MSEPAEPSAAESAPRRRWTLSRWVSVVAVLAAAFTVLVIVGGAVAVLRLTDARERLADDLDPAVRTAQELGAGLINQETGVRGYLLGRDAQFLTPYTDGRAAEQTAMADLDRYLGTGYPQVSADQAAVFAAAERWRAEYAEPTIHAVEATPAGATPDAPPAAEGRALFEDVRGRLHDLDSRLEQQRTEARGQLATAAGSLERIGIAIAVALVIAVVGLVIGLRRGVTRPVRALAAQVRSVASGDFEHPVRAGGPEELMQLGRDVDAMRGRILAELLAVRVAHEQLDAQAVELQRSNAELEQFAYVASHDLQEPLRKVASFCQLLADRYSDVVDERGRQYIDFAVDGARRMQALISDLLAFSRVGRLRAESRDVDVGTLVDAATDNLAAAIDETGTRITTEELPTVHVDPVLLTNALQNLIGNAIKFRRPDVPPEIRISARDDSEEWLFTVADNGIGIEPEYADRIFTIFQRLHPRDVYPGTGIGLAMVKKIIEYHGGRVWLETSDPGRPGSTFHFTLPQHRSPEFTESPQR